MIGFRSVNTFALGFLGPPFYTIPFSIHGILKFRAKNEQKPERIASFEKRALAFMIDFAVI
jgi:hypothetical protein